MGDVKEGCVLPGMKGGVDDTQIFILHWHGPASEWYHAPTMGYVEVIEGSPVQLIRALEESTKIGR